MPIREFPFLSLSPEFSPQPFLPLRVRNPHTGKTFGTFGLIDTGADYTAIPEWLASELGHDVRKGECSVCHTGNGITQQYHHTFSIDIFQVKDNKPHASIALSIAPREYGVLPMMFVLLGVNDFLNEYILTIHYPRQIFSIQRP